MNQNETNVDYYMEIAGCVNDTLCYENILKDTNLSINNYTLFNKLTTSFYNDGQKNFIIILIIYVGCMLGSIGIYTLFAWIYTKNNSSSDKSIIRKIL